MGADHDQAILWAEVLSTEHRADARCLIEQYETLHHHALTAVLLHWPGAGSTPSWRPRIIE